MQLTLNRTKQKASLIELFMQTKKSSAGFTLVEVLVALSVFTLVVLAAVSALFIVNDSAKKTQARRTVLDNLSFALEDMSRTVRVSTNYHCSSSAGSNLLSKSALPPTDCPYPSGSQSLAVTSPDGDLIAYRLSKGVSVSTGQSTSVIQKCIILASASAGVVCDWIDVTAPEVEISNLSFFVNGTTPADPVQPHAYVFVSGVVKDRFGRNSEFSIQTFLSQRPYDI